MIPFSHIELIYQIGIPFLKFTKIPSQLDPYAKLSILTPLIQVKSLTIFSKNSTTSYSKNTHSFTQNTVYPNTDSAIYKAKKVLKNYSP
jgi:hypothetical protein